MAEWIRIFFIEVEKATYLQLVIYTYDSLYAPRRGAPLYEKLLENEHIAK